MGKRTYVRSHQRNNKKTPGKHRVRGHYRSITSLSRKAIRDAETHEDTSMLDDRQFNELISEAARDLAEEHIDEYDDYDVEELARKITQEAGCTYKNGSGEMISRRED